MAFKIELPEDSLKELCKKWKIAELSFFGSVVRDDFTANSDVDILIKYLPGIRRTLLDHIRLQNELSEMLGHQVDLVNKKAIEKSPDEKRRIAILSEAQVFYLDEAA